MQSKIVRIYVDANVLINYCTGQPNDIGIHWQQLDEDLCFDGFIPSGK